MESAEYDNMAQFEDHHWWFCARRGAITAMLDSLKLPKNVEILEIGCASGGNFEMLSHYGNVYAVEMNDSAIKRAKSREIAQDVSKATLPEDRTFDGKTFDLIVLLDVLEHIDQDLETLKSLHDSLKDDGVILVTVPAFPSLWSEHDVALHHKRRYTKKTLAKVIKDSGYNKRKLTYYNFFLFIPISAVRIMRKVFGTEKKSQSDLKMPSRFMNEFYKKVFAPEKWFIAKTGFPFGISLMAVIQKK
jgi:SAM-dependent methyltransferase